MSLSLNKDRNAALGYLPQLQESCLAPSSGFGLRKNLYGVDHHKTIGSLVAEMEGARLPLVQVERDHRLEGRLVVQRQALMDQNQSLRAGDEDLVLHKG